MRHGANFAAALLSVALVVPTSAIAKEPVASDPSAPAKPQRAVLRASLEVDSSALGDEGDALTERLEAEGAALLRREEVLPRRTLEDGLIVVRVKEGEGGGYHFDVYAKHGDTKLASTVVSRECVGCMEADLVAQIGASIVECIPALRETAAPVEGAAIPEQQPAHDESLDDRPRTRLGPMGKAGVGVLVAGAAALVVGVVFAVRGRAYSTEPGAATQEGSDFRPPGIGLAVAGGVALITGATLLGVDLKRSKARVSASVTPNSGGLVLRGRF